MTEAQAGLQSVQLEVGAGQVLRALEEQQGRTEG